MTLEDLKSAAHVVGMKETERAIEKQEAACVFIASDCDERIARPFTGSLPVVRDSCGTGIHEERNRPCLRYQSESCIRCHS